MKKFLLILVASLAITAIASAQPRAIGIRGTYGVEASYQHTIGGANFAEIDLGLFSGYFAATGIYNFNIASAGDFHFYAGPGVSFLVASGVSLLGIAGQIGGEYQIPTIPLNISLDWRPGYYFSQGGSIFNVSGVAIGIRYRF